MFHSFIMKCLLRTSDIHKKWENLHLNRNLGAISNIDQGSVEQNRQCTMFDWRDGDRIMEHEKMVLFQFKRSLYYFICHCGDIQFVLSFVFFSSLFRNLFLKKI